MSIYNNPNILARIFAASEARAKEFLENAPQCEVCGRLVATRRARHASCEPNSLAGLTCVCRGCTDKAWGDRDACEPSCEPCKIMSGQPYRKL